MALTAEQRKTARQFAKAVRRTGASPMLTEALYEAGLTEAELGNPNYGDRDSVGSLQERSHYGSTSRRLDPYKAALRFIQEGKALQAKGFKGSSGALAQAIQRSAFPDRYEQRDDEAERIIGKYVRGVPQGGSQSPSTPLDAGGTPFDPGQVTDLSSLVEGITQRPARPTASGPAAPAFSARNMLPQAGQGIQTSGPRAAKPDLSAVLEQVRSASQSLPETQATAASSERAKRSSSAKGLSGAVDLVDSLIGKHGAPITAKQEPGHAEGGDHDPAVKGATARDVGGDERTRERIFKDLMRQLGVKGAVYKGPDVNVTKGGVRYQVISRDHGSGPHLHIGIRRARQ